MLGRLGTFGFNTKQYSAFTAFTVFDFLRLFHVAFDPVYVKSSYMEEHASSKPLPSNLKGTKWVLAWQCKLQNRYRRVYLLVLMSYYWKNSLTVSNQA